MIFILIEWKKIVNLRHVLMRIKYTKGANQNKNIEMMKLKTLPTNEWTIDFCNWEMQR